MREIKFRAWDKEQNCMLSSKATGLIIHFDGTVNAYDSEGTLIGTEFINELEVMQYTGLKDKYGKDIYEGDLCKSYNGYIQEVVWRDNSWMYKMKVNKKYQGEAYVEIVYSSMGDTSHRNFGDEIIGNIYENPELLEG